MKKNKVWFLFLGLAATGSIVFLAVSLGKTNSPKLIQGAIPLLTNKSWFVSDGGLYTWRYFWAGQKVIFTAREVSQGDYEPLLVNIQTGEETRVDGLLGAFSGHEKRSDFWFWSLPPSGDRVLTITGESPRASSSLVSFTGEVVNSWTNDWQNAPIYWNSTANNWVTSIGRTYFQNDWKTGSSIDVFTNEDRSFVGIGFVRSNLFLGRSQTGNGQLNLVRYPLETLMAGPAGMLALPGRDRTAPETNTLLFPERYVLCESNLSGDGQKIAWVFGERKRMPRIRPRWGWPFYRVHPLIFFSLWTSHSDGRDFHHLVTLPESEEFSGIRWKPDNFTLTFINSNILYQVESR